MTRDPTLELRQRKMPIRLTATRVVQLICVISLIVICSFLGGCKKSGTPPLEDIQVEDESSAMIQEIEANLTPTNTPSPLEVSEKTNISPVDILGEAKVEYPMRMSPGSSNTIAVSIHIPRLLASTAPQAMARVEIPDDLPAVIGKVDSYRATILVQDPMRVELIAPNFSITPLYPATQPVDVSNLEKHTFWAWTIVAPNTLGKQVFTVLIYRTDQDAPVWARSFEMDIVERVSTPTPTVSPTPTPTPTLIPTPTLTPTPTPTPIWSVRLTDQLTQPPASSLLLILTVLALGVLAASVWRRRAPVALATPQSAEPPSYFDGIHAPELPKGIYARLYSTLLRCGPFQTNRDLKNVFGDPRIAPWRAYIPEADSEASRVTNLITHLLKCCNTTGDNALALFLHVLSDQCHPDDACYRDLVGLAEELEKRPPQ